MSREDIIEKSCRDMLALVPPAFDVESVLQQYPTMYSESMNTVLTQECIRFNGLLVIVKQSLLDTLKALKGIVVMTPELEMLCNSVFNNQVTSDIHSGQLYRPFILSIYNVSNQMLQVPDLWAGKAYPSLKPLSAWMADLIERVKFINTWIREGVPTVFWISGFFFPQAFLTGTLQNFARKYQYPIDTVSFDFVCMDNKDYKSITKQPDDGCYIRGLYLEGARWDYERHVVTESRPKELYTELPIMWLKPQQFRKKPTSGIYECPVYKTLLRAGMFPSLDALIQSSLLRNKPINM